MLNSKLPTVEEMEKIMRDRGKWTDKDDNEIEMYKEDLAENQAELILVKTEYKKTKSPKLKTKLTKLETESKRIKDEFTRKEGFRSKFKTNTIEGRADEKRLITKMSRCILKPDGSRVWETPGHLAKEKDSAAVGQLVYLFITFMQGIDPRLLEQVPEILSSLGDIES